MDFIEREKLRIEEEQKKKEAEKKAKEDLSKRKELELQNKRDSIYKKVGPFMEQLLQKTIEKQKQAEAEKLPDSLNAIHGRGEVFKGWKWEIDWLNTTPRLWGHFQGIENIWLWSRDDKEDYGNGKFDSIGRSKLFTYYSNTGEFEHHIEWTIYIKCLVDVDNMALGITAKSEKYSNRYCFEDERRQDNSKSLQAPYLENKGLIIPITKDDSLIDMIADILIEIRYTWKCQVAGPFFKKMRCKKINNSLKKLGLSLQSYDNMVNDKNERIKINKKKEGKSENFARWVGFWIATPAWILFIIYMFIVNGVADGIFGGIILGFFAYIIFFGIIYGISKLLALSLGYSYIKEDEKKDSLEIKNYETKISYKKNEISDLLKNLRATIDKDNIDEFVGDEIILEFPLTDKFNESESYTKKDFISKIESLLNRSKYEKK